MLLLRPTVLRGLTPEQTVRLPGALPSLETQIIVPETNGRYEVRVQSVSGQIAYRDLAPQSLGGVSFVQLSIPRARLSPGTYRFLLLEAGPGAPRPLRSYTVRVIAP